MKLRKANSILELVGDTLDRMAGTDPGRPSKPDDLSVIAFRLHPGARVLRRLTARNTGSA